jgi:hypothetical protein
MSWGIGVKLTPHQQEIPSLSLVVYRSESNFCSPFYLTFPFYYNLLSFLGPSDVLKNQNINAWGLGY